MGRIIKIKLLVLLFVAGISISANDTYVGAAKHPSPEEIAKADQWVNSVFESMTKEERIAQLIIIRGYSNKTVKHTQYIESLIKKYQIGGICFFQGSPERQAELTNRYQKLTKHVPLMVSMDAEWGLGMRLKETALSYPRQLMLGAIQDNRLIYDMGKDIARQFHRLGVHMNFAPVADVNNNADNPVINTRSFGEDRYNVAAKTYMYMKGMQDSKVIASAKHFPGHGDTDVDSHYDLPVINHNKNRLDSIELFPFRILTQQGIGSVMVAHMHVPVLDSRTNRPTSLSKNTITNLLKEDLGYNGLIITDGLGMKGVTKHHKAGEVEAEALVAGNDLLLLPSDIEATFKAINRYIDEGKLDIEQIYQSVKKLLRAKYYLGLTNFTPIPLANIRTELNSAKAQVLKRQLIENALTLVHNKNDIIPIRDIQSLSMGSLAMGSLSRTQFQQTLGQYGKVEHFNVGKEISSSKFDYLFNKLRQKKMVFISLHDMNSTSKKNFGITRSEQDLIEALRKETAVILTVFGNPYSLKYFDKIDWLLEAYDEDSMTQELAAQGLFGAFAFRGRLPVTASSKSCFNAGITTTPIFRLGYDLPESVGLSSSKLNRIDGLVQEAIRTKATPGAVVLVAKDGKVVFNKAYGHHTYSKRTKMSKSDVFDLASITKIAASTLSAMKLHEEGKINIYEPISNYLTELQGTDKRNLTIYDIMSHRAGLKAWIPFFEQTVTKSKRNPRPLPKYYSKRQSDKFSIPVTEKLFMVSSFQDEIWKQIRESELRSSTDYKYSDLGFYLVASMVQRITGKRIDQYVQETFYQPMGLNSVTYNPHLKFPLAKVVPTEEDKYWRRQRVHAYVHDMGAAMLGGVSGHAGLFANANDLAAIIQMLLNGGYYGGRQYLKAETIRAFTNRHEKDTRRGIGFDMKELSPRRSQNMSHRASANTFGHLGFTGTCVWADPESNLVYVFLSNRTYPSMHNYKLSTEDYRPRIQTMVYEAMVE